MFDTVFAPRQNGCEIYLSIIYLVGAGVMRAMEIQGAYGLDKLTLVERDVPV